MSETETVINGYTVYRDPRSTGNSVSLDSFGSMGAKRSCATRISTPCTGSSRG